jgi:hypothetical protein
MAPSFIELVVRGLWAARSGEQRESRKRETLSECPADPREIEITSQDSPGKMHDRFSRANA